MYKQAAGWMLFLMALFAGSAVHAASDDEGKDICPRVVSAAHVGSIQHGMFGLADVT